MAFADGDDFVSGSILSFQQANRIKNHFRLATAPSSPVGGMIRSDSDDDKLHHYGTAWEEVLQLSRSSDVDPAFNDIQIAKSVLRENLIGNSGFGVWSQSDASKGLATITYDSGGNTALVVGETLTGNTSGATCKVISYTTASGTWAGGDAAGVITVGACSHDFAWIDNETVTGSGAGADAFTVNMPDSAVGVGLIQNGGFPIDTDPPPGWTASNATLSTEAGGLVGNCMKVLDDGAGNGYGYQSLTTVVGKIYKVSVWAKDIDTGTNGLIEVGTSAGDATYYSSGAITDDAGATYTITFEATTTTMVITLNCTSAGGAYYFDEVTCYEITPCCTAADAVAFDGWYKDTTIDIYRQHNDGGTLTKDGSFHSLKCVPTTADDFIIWPLSALRDNEEWYQQFAGETVTFGCWVKTSKASHFFIQLIDSDTTDYDQTSDGSSFHTGGGAWEWLEVSMTVSASTTEFSVAFVFDQTGEAGGDTIVYISQPMLVFGSYIGEGNYKPIPQEEIWLEKRINSNTLHNQQNLSDVAVTDLNLEADSDAMLPKGAKTIWILGTMRDSGSAANACYVYARKDSTQVLQFIISAGGITNNMYNYFPALPQALDENGDYDYAIEASGAGTLDLTEWIYVGIQVN